MDQQRCIGLIIDRMTGSFFFELIVGAHAAAHAAGYKLLVIEGAFAPFAEARLAADLVDGWIIAIDSEHIERLARLGKPVVQISIRSDVLPLASVFPDNASGMRQIMRHLLDAGHRQIAWVGYFKNADFTQRRAGFEAELRAAGIEPDPDLIVDSGGYGASHGLAAARQILASGKPFSAVVAALDANAIGVLEALREAGKGVPADVAVVGWDDDISSSYTSPPLTTVRQYPRAMGGKAVELIVEQRHGLPISPEPHLVPVRLVVRASSGGAAPPLADAERAPGATIARVLVERLLHPFPLAAEADPSTLWPSVGLLAEPPYAPDGQPPPTEAQLLQLWREALAHAHDVKFLLALVELAERHAGPDAGWHEAKARYFTRVRSALSYALAERYTSQLGHHHALLLNQRMMSANLMASTNLRSLEPGAEPHEASSSGFVTSLRWLKESRARWAVLAGWETDAEGRPTLRVRGAFRRDGRQTPEQPSIDPARFPLDALAPGDVFAHADEIVRVIRVGLGGASLGLIVYCEPLSPIDHDTVIMSTEFLGAILERAQLLDSLREAKEAAEAAHRAAEAARQVAESASNAKSTFLAKMSHELRSPLNVIINFTKFLDKPRFGSLNPRQRDLQQRVVSNADHLLGLINDVLDLAKIESGKLDLQVEATDLGPVIKVAADTALGLIREKPVALITELSDELPPVLIDKTRIHQVLLNLLSNAAKFTERGSIIVRARSGDGMVEVAVIDTGIGIAPEHHAQIFEEFRQVDDAFTRHYQGTGLGLPICRHLIEMHGGTLALSSQLGQGSTFSFTLPVAAGPGGDP